MVQVFCIKKRMKKMTEPKSEGPENATAGIEFLRLVENLHFQLLEILDYHKVDLLQEAPIDLNLFLLQEIEKLVNKDRASRNEDLNSRLKVALFDEVMGFGPIEPLIRDNTVTDIFVNAPDKIYVERRGRVEKTTYKFLNEEHILRLVQRFASKSGRHLDLGMPYFDSQLPDGTRIHAIIPPVAIDGIKVSLRKYSFQKLNLDSLVNGGSLNSKMAEMLNIAVQARFNIVICGGTGSGKTTILNAILASIRKGERIITIEDTPELEPTHHHNVRLLTRIANSEGKGAVTQGDLMINALRMRPDRVILGELRGSEAFNLLHAMNTGQDGSMVTLHASGAEEAISRLLNMILMARYSLSSESVRQQIAGALDLVIYVTRLVDGSRRVMNISQVSEDSNGAVKIEDIFRFHIEKITAEELRGKFQELHTLPTKRMLSKLVTAGLVAEYEACIKGGIVG
jgi:pilus assembly protein CpaF